MDYALQMLGKHLVLRLGIYTLQVLSGKLSRETIDEFVVHYIEHALVCGGNEVLKLVARSFYSRDRVKSETLRFLVETNLIRLP